MMPKKEKQKATLRDEQSKYKAKKQMHRQFGMITPGGVNTRKTTLSEMCGSNDLKMRRRLLKSETPQMQEVFSLLLLNVFLKS